MKRVLGIAAVFVVASAFVRMSEAQVVVRAVSLSGGVGFSEGDGIRLGVNTGQSLVGISSDEFNAAAAGFWYTTLETITVVSSTIERVGEEIPVHYQLEQNYPNPFNPTTRIKYGLPESAQARVTVYNVLGQLVSIVIDKDQAAGYYEVNWDAMTDSGVNLPSGLYFYRLETNNFSATRSMVFQK